MKKYPLLLIVLVCAVLGSNAGSLFATEGNFQFKVTNTTDEKITQLLASEDGKSYAKFDIGKGIKPGETITLVWDKKTDESSCEWFFKAVFADGSESESKSFDFCEDDLELEF